MPLKMKTRKASSLGKKVLFRQRKTNRIILRLKKPAESANRKSIIKITREHEQKKWEKASFCNILIIEECVCAPAGAGNRFFPMCVAHRASPFWKIPLKSSFPVQITQEENTIFPLASSFFHSIYSLSAAAGLVIG